MESGASRDHDRGTSHLRWRRKASKLHLLTPQQGGFPLNVPSTVFGDPATPSPGVPSERSIETAAPPDAPLAVQHIAPLIAALFHALTHCPPEFRANVLAPLDSTLGKTVHDFPEKFTMLLDSSLSVRDTIQGLWLLYLTLRFHHQDSLEIWIGPDPFSDDAASHLRIQGGELSGSERISGHCELEHSLAILAWSVSNTARTSLRRIGPGQLAVVLEDDTQPA